MSGTVTVTKVNDWLTPFEVEVRSDVTGKVAASRFSAASRAQEYALRIAEAQDMEVVYNVDRGPAPGPQPRTVSVEDFRARMPRVCSKCREAKPLAEFSQEHRTNRSTGRIVPCDYNEKCNACLEAG